MFKVTFEVTPRETRGQDAPEVPVLVSSAVSVPRLAVSTDDRYALHVAPGFHPERPERLFAARRALRTVDIPQVHLPSCLATTEQLALVHDDNYLADLEKRLATGHGYLDPDTYFSPPSRQAAWLAAGSGCVVIDALLDGRAELGALIARPPGHHATRQRAMGFCLINNIAVAAMHARSRGSKRVAIVDWDVHHGNGTQDIFEHDPNVVVVSLHQWPLYPGTGAVHEVGLGDGRGATVNIPLPPGSDGSVYAAAFERLVLPVLSEARPDLLLVSAGFDAHARDPLANMNLTEDDYAWMASRLRSLALSLGHGRVALFLEGGYDLQALERSLAATLRGLATPHDLPHPSPRSLTEQAEQALRAAIEAQRPYWRGVL